MHIGVPAETRPGETRVAATAETVTKLVKQGHSVTIETGAGVAAGQLDAAYTAAGATVGSREEAFGAQIIFKVRAPDPEETRLIHEGGLVIGMLDPFDREGLGRLARRNLIAFSLEAAPRTTRAQSLDVLSSQANLAGYKAVMVAANAYPKLMPMMMTAAGTIKAARTVILGAGVAGLQAIATARRLGAIVEVSDVRPAVKEQVESLGAKYIDVPYETDEERDAAQGVGGYARPMPASWMARQAEEVAKRLTQADIVITTALIPGRKAPMLISRHMVQAMKPGSVIVDMAAGQGGNCELSSPDAIVEKHDVQILGPTNLPALVPADASALYARNVIDFLKLIIDKDGYVEINMEDDIVKACMMCGNGRLMHDKKE
ncbi:MAG: Re/Si-specific NAD(P)(+) transhydrogenase subunit alpha [Burkholderiaceae bacterium]